MCRMCDGYSADDVLRELDLTIRVHGFTRVGVGDGSASGWTYTVGLAENFGHPDLICIEIEPEAQHRFLNAVGEMVVEGRSAPDPAELGALDLELVEVHPTHLGGSLVACWANRYGRPAGAGDFVQVFPGPSHFCAEHASWPRRLDDPRPLVGLTPNRAERRARRRGRHRRGGRPG